MSSESVTRWLLVAHLVRPQGRRGELLADLHTEHPDRFSNDARVFLAPPGFSGAAELARVAHVTSFWLPTGKSQGRIVLKLDLSTSIDQAEQLAGNDVLVPYNERRALADDAVYVHELIGCKLLDGEAEVGVIRDVLALSPAADADSSPEAAPVLVVVDAAGVEFLVPFARAYLQAVDLDRRRVQMTLPDALLDLYRPASPVQKRNAKPSETTG